jgi:hypothetical protein
VNLSTASVNWVNSCSLRKIMTGNSIVRNTITLPSTYIVTTKIFKEMSQKGALNALELQKQQRSYCLGI